MDDTNDGGAVHQWENILHNGLFNICQRAVTGLGSIALTNNTLMYGDLDRWKVKIAAGTTGSGTFGQSTNLTIFPNGYSAYSGVATITTTGTGGTFTIRQYVEARNAYKLYNRNAIFSCKVYNSTAGSLNYVMNMYPMTGADNGTAGSALTGGNLGSNQSVASATPITINSGAIAMGTNVSNGLIVEIVINCGTVSGAQFFFGECQLQLGSTVTPIDVPDFEVELAKCQRSYQKSYPYTTTVPSATNYGYNTCIGNSGGTLVWCGLIFQVEFRKIPNMAIYAPTSTTLNTVYDTVSGGPIAFVTGTGDLSTKCLGYLTGTATAGRLYLYGWAADADF